MSTNSRFFIIIRKMCPRKIVWRLRSVTKFKQQLHAPVTACPCMFASVPVDYSRLLKTKDRQTTMSFTCVIELDETSETFQIFPGEERRKSLGPGWQRSGVTSPQGMARWPVFANWPSCGTLAREPTFPFPCQLSVCQLPVRPEIINAHPYLMFVIQMMWNPTEGSKWLPEKVTYQTHTHERERGLTLELEKSYLSFFNVVLLCVYYQPLATLLYTAIFFALFSEFIRLEKNYTDDRKLKLSAAVVHMLHAFKIQLALSESKFAACVIILPEIFEKLLQGRLGSDSPASSLFSSICLHSLWKVLIVPAGYT